MSDSGRGVGTTAGSFHACNSNSNSNGNSELQNVEADVNNAVDQRMRKRKLILVPLTFVLLLGILCASLYAGGVFNGKSSSSDSDPSRRGEETSQDCPRPRGVDGSELPRFRSIDASGYGITTNEPMMRLMEPRDFNTWASNSPDIADLSDALDLGEGTLHDGTPHHDNYTSLIWLWGQFIDHTIVRTSTSSEFLYTGRNRFPSNRTAAIIDGEGVRHQINELSPYIDGSMVYGSEVDQAESLRRLDGTGKLLTSQTEFITSGPEQEMLPFNPNRPGHVLAGDARVEEHVGLTAIHTLFLREHNFWCDELKREHPAWDEEELYNTARHIVVGEIQAITYESWLPMLLGKRDSNHTREEGDRNPDGRQKDGGDRRSTQNSTDRDGNSGESFCPQSAGAGRQAAMYNEFAAAGYRFGHAMVNECLQYRSPTDGSIQGCLFLKDAFFQRDIAQGSLFQRGVGSFLLGASKQNAKQRTPSLVDSMRVLLFLNSSVGDIAFDLAALNIARGRDHSLPSYQELYQFATGTPLANCSQLSASESTCSSLESLYDGPLSSVAIDPWIGVLVERNLSSGALGKVSSMLVKKQFDLLRESDPYFYQWDRVVQDRKDAIQKTRLRDVIARNTNVRPELLPKNVFVQEKSPSPPPPQ